MSRPASGDTDVLFKARQSIASATTVEQLRQAQAVVLPMHPKRVDVGGKTGLQER